jgi:hypothetical protein
MNTNKLYKPLDLRREINKYMQIGMHDDVSDIVETLTTSPGEREYVTSKDMSRALKILENEIDLIKETSKMRVKSIKGKQKIDFLGRPIFYKLPPGYESLKRVISNPKAIKLVFKSLIRLGLLPHLQFIAEAAFYIMMDSIKKEQKHALARVANKLVPEAEIDKSGWESYRSLLLSLSEDQLKSLAAEVIKLIVQHPQGLRFIVLVSLSRNQ